MPQTSRKRHAATQSTQVSSSIRLIAHKKSRKGKSQLSPSTLANQAIPFQNAWDQLQSSISCALHNLSSPALSKISTALSATPPDHTVPTVCVTLGPSAAAGDRAQAFDAVRHHVIQEIPSATVLRFQSTSHSSMNAVTAQFEQIINRPPSYLIVAVDDADLLPEAVLRDLVYLSCKQRAPAGKSEHVSIVLGFGAGVDALHAALGVQELGMIALTSVKMPPAAANFRVVVEGVLAKRETSLVLSARVFRLIEEEFFGRESTLAMVMRCLKMAYALQFYEYLPVAALLVGGGDHGDVGKMLDDESLTFLRENVKSVSSELEKRETELKDDELRPMVIQWYGNIAKWRRKCALVESLMYKLLVHIDVKTLPGTRDKFVHTDLRLQVFRAFLVSTERGLRIDSENLYKLIDKKISRYSTRQYLIKIIDVLVASIEQWDMNDDEDVEDNFHRLTELKERLETSVKANVEEVDEIAARKAQKPQRMSARGGYAAQELRRERLTASIKQPRASNLLKEPRNKLSCIVKDLLDMVGSLQELPMHELYILANEWELKQLCGGMSGAAEPRKSLFTAMRSPQQVLGEFSEAIVPDTAVAYRLLTEGGRMKNIYDWYNTFSTVKTASAVERDDDGNITRFADIPQAELQAGFAQACSELEFLGVMKYTNRKTDHVLRLAFE